MTHRLLLTIAIGMLVLVHSPSGLAQDDFDKTSHTLYDIAPRTLVDLPTAGTLPRGTFNIGLRLYAQGGAQGYTDIGLSERFTIGISYGGTSIMSSEHPEWNPAIGFSLKLRVVDEMEFFPAIAVGFSDQGHGPYLAWAERYTFKSRGFFAVASRSFYFYKWTAGWHFGTNYSKEDDYDDDSGINFFGGFDATFNYNLALLLEVDAAMNDNRGDTPVPGDHPNRTSVSGKGRGYVNLSIKWLFARNLELEVLLKDLAVNRRESATITREIRMMFIDSF